MAEDRVLIAEDDEGIQDLIASELADAGWKVSSARSGAEVLASIREEAPTLLLLDYGLPDMDAQELIEAIRGEGLTVPPFILSTGRGDEDLAVRMMKLGARDYVVKDTVFLRHLAGAAERVRGELRREAVLKETQRALGASEALLFGIFSQAPIAILVTDARGRATNANAAFELLWGVEGLGTSGTVNVLEDPSCRESGFSELIAPAYRGNVCREYGFSHGRPFGEPSENRIILNIIAFPIMEEGILQSVVILQEDVTARYLAEERAHRLSLFDPLTGLPNRKHVMDRIVERMNFLRRYGTPDALMLVNVDRFKIINEVRGNLAGDELISQVGARLRGALRDVDFLGRIAADEFAVILPTEGQNPDKNSLSVLSAAERLRQTLKEPLNVGSERHEVSVSVGITLFPESPSDSPSEAFRRADTALHRAKEGGGNQSAFFELGMGNSARERYRVERELSEAVSRGEFELYLQPQVLRSGKPVGAECLIRWRHPERGLLAPGAFIPIAEESDLIVRIGEWVLNEACALLAGPLRPRDDFRLSVNVSPRHFAKPDFVDWIVSLFDRFGVDPRRVVLEITEGLFLGNSSGVVERMGTLSQRGFEFSVDDFGTGYSSLAYLKRLPLSELKIDKAFVQDAGNDANDGALVESIVAVAQRLGLSLVAEGVETESQADFLAALAEMRYQGYLFARPAPAEEVIAALG